MPPKVKFQDGERILCFHGPLLYEAKCVKADVKEKSIRYLIHYNGWNKNWDEWVPESRVLKYNEASIVKQRELSRAHASKAKLARGKLKKAEKAEKEKEKELKDKTNSPAPPPPPVERKKALKEKDKDKEREKEKDKECGTPVAPSASIVSVVSTTDSNSSSDQPKKKRARVDPTVESEENYLTKIEVKVKIPEELKLWLVDDWDLITRQKQLLDLPCKMTVDMIIADYIKAKTSKPNCPQKDAIQEVTQGVREYFNVMLGTQLLYKFERSQYSEVLAEHSDKPISNIYGATHMLRLFVRLGGMLAYTPLEEKSIQLLVTHVHDFLKYMAKNSSQLFSTSDYIVASPEYHRKSM